MRATKNWGKHPKEWRSDTNVAESVWNQILEWPADERQNDEINRADFFCFFACRACFGCRCCSWTTSVAVRQATPVSPLEVRVVFFGFVLQVIYNPHVPSFP